MKVKHLALLVLGTSSFLASCGCSNYIADQRLLDNINAVIARHASEINTCSDAVGFAKKGGYDLENYTLSKKSYSFAYDWAGKKFVIMEGDKIVCTPSYYHINSDTYNYFKFTSHYDAASVYSQYLTKDFEGADMLVVTTGLDMGNNWNVKNLIYNNTSDISKKIFLNTYSDYLTITAPKDNVVHYGDANNVFIASMGEDKEFHAYGTYAYIQPSMGNIYLESGASTDLFEMKDNSTANVHIATDVTIIAAINAPMVPTTNDIKYIAVNGYNDIISNDALPIDEDTINFFRLNSDVSFPKTNDSTNAWLVKHNFFLDLNGHKMEFYGNSTSMYLDKYHEGIVLDAATAGSALECYIVDTQATLFERPSIELNDCSIIVAGDATHEVALNITSGRIDDIRGVADDFTTNPVSYNNPAVLVIGNTSDDLERVAYNSSFHMYGGYIRSKKGEKYNSVEASLRPSFKCIQPRGKGAYVDMSYGDLNSYCFCISGQGEPPVTGKADKYGETKIEIKGGTFIGGTDSTQLDDYTTFFFPQSGEVKITGGNVTGRTCVDIKAGTLIIDGATFNSTDDWDETVVAQYNGSDVDGSVILVESTNYYCSNIKININNAKMKSKNAYIVNVVGPDGLNPKGEPDTPKDTDVVFDGGTFTYKLGEGYRVDQYASSVTHFTKNGGTWIKGE